MSTGGRIASIISEIATCKLTRSTKILRIYWIYYINIYGKSTASGSSLSSTLFHARPFYPKEDIISLSYALQAPNCFLKSLSIQKGTQSPPKLQSIEFFVSLFLLLCSSEATMSKILTRQDSSMGIYPMITRQLSNEFPPSCRFDTYQPIILSAFSFGNNPVRQI